jgi:hypothetical protein
MSLACTLGALPNIRDPQLTSDEKPPAIMMPKSLMPSLASTTDARSLTLENARR